MEENWECSRPMLFKHVVMSAALPPHLVSKMCHLPIAIAG